MAKLSNVYTRIDPDIKEQAEAVLNGLGLSMATAMECFLRQVAYQRKIPFEMAMPSNPPISFHDLSGAQFNALMDKAMKQYSEGKCISIENFEQELGAELNI